MLSIFLETSCRCLFTNLSQQVGTVQHNFRFVVSSALFSLFAVVELINNNNLADPIANDHAKRLFSARKGLLLMISIAFVSGFIVGVVFFLCCTATVIFSRLALLLIDSCRLRLK